MLEEFNVNEEYEATKITSKSDLTMFDTDVPVKLVSEFGHLLR